MRLVRCVPGTSCVGLAVLVVAASACSSGGSAKPRQALPVTGSFEVIPQPLMPLGIGDCNGDGLIDVFGSGRQTGFGLWVRQPDGTMSGPTERIDLMINSPQGVGGVSFADVDGDGKVDLVAGLDGLYFLRGHGDCTFDPPQRISAPRSCHIGQVQVTDVDLDGVPDVAYACQFEPGAPLPDPPAPLGLLVGRGDGTFTELVEPVSPPSPTFHYTPFGHFFADFDGDGVRDYVGMIDTGQSWMNWGDAGDLPSFSQHDEALTELLASDDPMSFAPLDFDRDGKLDYDVAELDQRPVLLTFHGRSFQNRADDAFLAVTDVPGGGELWGTFALDADFDGWTDLLSLRTTADNQAAPAVFFHNNRDGTFTHWTTDAVFDFSTRITKMLCGDLASTGVDGCYVPGDNDSEPSYLVENHLAAAGGWVGIRLRGTVSSPEAEGATVALSGAKPPLVMYYGAQSPARCENDRGLLMAVGDEASAAVDVTWPSGVVQHVEGLVAGTYTTIEEPPVLRVPRRIVQADGVDWVDVQVTPALSGWTGDVTIEREGDGSFAGEATNEDGVWTRRLVAPTSPGDARLDVTIGGHRLLVRPRVTFVAP